MGKSVSEEKQLIRPEDIMGELGIKKSKYYDVLRKLNIKAVKDGQMTASTKGNLEKNIYVEPEEPTSQYDMERLMREAAELKARELAMPALVKRAIADQMTEGDLPEDLKEKVSLAREAANPKYTPAVTSQ